MPVNNLIVVEDLQGGYGEGEDRHIVLECVNLNVRKGEILAIVGPSGCGKSTVMRHLIGLEKPWKGRVLFDGTDIHKTEKALSAARRRWGITFQSGALLGNLTILENVILPLQEYTSLSPKEIKLTAYQKLETVGLDTLAASYPMDISGGQQKRAGLARAIALDPEVLFFDEPSAGLDPITSSRLDNLIVKINEVFNTTVVIVTHELASIYAISDRVVMLDPLEKSIIAEGSAVDLRDKSTDKRVIAFFRREDVSKKG